MGQPFHVVDAFTDRPFAGNPAAVCVMNAAAAPAPEALQRREHWMQLCAREMNLAETAFLLPEGDGFRLRWFTPTVEVDLCGHATLASAHVLWTTGRLAPTQAARFFTRSGTLGARHDEAGLIELDFPALPALACPPPVDLQAALGARPVFVGRNQHHFLVELADEDTVRRLTPDLARIAQIPAAGVIVTARSTQPRYDFVSRFFGPAVGIPEDPVTGSAHCAGPHWSERLGKPRLIAYQASPRGGTVHVRVHPSGDRVFLAGQAITISKGEILSADEM